MIRCRAKRKGQAMVKPGPEHSPDRAWEGGGRGLDDVGPVFKSPHLKKTFPVLKKQQLDPIKKGPGRLLSSQPRGPNNRALGNGDAVLQ